MEKKSLGLVFAGGGAKGAYQIGVWKALLELDLYRTVSAVSGTSIGALNAALFAEGDYEKAKQIWAGITADKVLFLGEPQNAIHLVLQSFHLPTVLFPFQLSVHGQILSAEAVEKIIRESISIKKIQDSDILLYAACTRITLPKLKKQQKDLSQKALFQKPIVLPKDQTVIALDETHPQKKESAVVQFCAYVEGVFEKLPHLSFTEASYFRLNKQSKKNMIRLLLASSAIPFVYIPRFFKKHIYVDGFLTDNAPIKPILKSRKADVILVVHLNPKEASDEPRPVHGKVRVFDLYPEQDLGNFIDFTPEHNVARMELGYRDAMILLSKDLV